MPLVRRTTLVDIHRNVKHWANGLNGMLSSKQSKLVVWIKPEQKLGILTHTQTETKNGIGMGRRRKDEETNSRSFTIEPLQWNTLLICQEKMANNDRPMAYHGRATQDNQFWDCAHLEREGKSERSNRNCNWEGIVCNSDFERRLDGCLGFSPKSFVIGISSTRSHSSLCLSLSAWNGGEFAYLKTVKPLDQCTIFHF